MTLTKASEQQVEKLAAQSQESFLDNLTGAFFRRIDWWAFWMRSAPWLRHDCKRLPLRRPRRQPGTRQQK